MKALVILVRGLHLGYLGCYGNGWIDTPTLDRLAAEGVVFDQHCADCPNAEGARRAWRTGQFEFPDTAGASSTACSQDLIGLLDAGSVHTNAVNGRVLEPTLQAARDALDQPAIGDQWLLWVDLATLLPPWEVPAEHSDLYFEVAGDEPNDEDAEVMEPASLEALPNPNTGPLQEPEETTFLRLQRTFAGAVSYVDAGIGLLLDALEERGLADEVFLIVISDHGQALGEHGIVGPYRPWLHDELIHVPLLIRLPHGEEAGRRIAALTQPVDLFPTLLDVFGLPSPSAHGHSLLPLIRGKTDRIRSYACSGLRLGERLEWALRTPEWSFILPEAAPPDDPPRLPQLYVKPDDRWEVNNVLQHHLEWAEHLEQTLRGFVKATRQPGPLQPPELRLPNSNPGAKFT
jgi:arylsulfatase A-like enzyme